MLKINSPAADFLLTKPRWISAICTLRFVGPTLRFENAARMDAGVIAIILHISASNLVAHLHDVVTLDLLDGIAGKLH